VAVVIIVMFLLALIVYRQRDRNVSDSALSNILAQWALFKCNVYAFWWGVRGPLRRALTNGALIVSAFSLVPVMLDVSAMIMGRRLVEFELPSWVQLAIIVAAVAMARHRYREWKRVNERSKLTTALRFVFREAGALNFSRCKHDAERLEKLDTFFTNVLKAFHEIYRARLDAKLNIMALTTGDLLKIQFVYPVGSTYDPKAEFAPGHGAAGVAFQDRHLVYVPAIKYRHGLAVTLPRPGEVTPRGSLPTFELKPDVYVAVDHQPYRSLLSVPIPTIDDSGYGVLNLDSDVQNAFNDADMEIADTAACALGMGIDRFRAQALK